MAELWFFLDETSRKGWQNYLHSQCGVHESSEGIKTGALIIHRQDVEHWEHQIKTPYSDLTEKEKESDRDQVDKFWPLIQERIQSLEAEVEADNRILAIKDTTIKDLEAELGKLKIERSASKIWTNFHNSGVSNVNYREQIAGLEADAKTHDEAYLSAITEITELKDQLKRHQRGSDKDRPQIICLCGSTRFYNEFQVANYSFTMEGNIILSVGFMPESAGHEHGESVGITPEQKYDLDELYKRKIDLADRVFVLNVGGYIGDSTRSEIEYSLANNTPVSYLEPINEVN